MIELRYGPDPAQVGELYPVSESGAPLVCLWHGGFWRMPHGREQMRPIAQDLFASGFTVWNLGYRRVGAAGGGWPGTLDDAGDGADHLATLAASGIAINLDRIALVGHSAGGQLALHVAGRHAGRVRPRLVIGLAPISDLELAHRLDLGHGAVAGLLGGTPAERPERYRVASPAANLPIGIPQLLLHGDDDADVPLALSRAHVQAAYATGDHAELVELADTGHMDFLDPASRAHAALKARLRELLQK